MGRFGGLPSPGFANISTAQSSATPTRVGVREPGPQSGPRRLGGGRGAPTLPPAPPVHCMGRCRGRNRPSKPAPYVGVWTLGPTSTRHGQRSPPRTSNPALASTIASPSPGIRDRDRAKALPERREGHHVQPPRNAEEGAPFLDPVRSSWTGLCVCSACTGSPRLGQSTKTQAHNAYGVVPR